MYTLFCVYFYSTCIYERQHEKTYLLTCATNEDTNQHARPRSLVRICIVRMRKLCTSFQNVPAEDSGQIARMRRLIWIFARRTSRKEEIFTFDCHILIHLRLNRISPHYILEESNFNLRYIRVSILDSPSEKLLTYLATAQTLIRHVRPTKTQISMRARAVWSEYVLSAWGNFAPASKMYPLKILVRLRECAG